MIKSRSLQRSTGGHIASMDDSRWNVDMRAVDRGEDMTHPKGRLHGSMKCYRLVLDYGGNLN